MSFDEPEAVPEAFGGFIQFPGAAGRVWDPSEVIAAIHDHGGLAVVAADLLALTLLRSPGSPLRRPGRRGKCGPQSPALPVHAQ